MAPAIFPSDLGEGGGGSESLTRTREPRIYTWFISFRRFYRGKNKGRGGREIEGTSVDEGYHPEKSPLRRFRRSSAIVAIRDDIRATDSAAPSAHTSREEETTDVLSMQPEYNTFCATASGSSDRAGGEKKQRDQSRKTGEKRVAAGRRNSGSIPRTANNAFTLMKLQEADNGM